MVSSSRVLVLLLIGAMLTGPPLLAQRLTGAVGMVNAGFTSTRHSGGSMNLPVSDSVRFGPRYAMVGAEAYYRSGRAIISASAYLGSQGAKSFGDRMLEPWLWNAHTGFGWLLSGNSSLCIYPAIGIGLSGLSVTEHRLYADSHKDIERTNAASADLSLHLDYLMLEPYSKERIVNGIVLGAKVGYNRTFSPTRLQGWYVTLSVGGLAFMRRR